MPAPYDEKEQLRGFALCVASRLGSAVSDDAWEPLRTTNSIRGLREAARDMAEWCHDLDPQQLAQIEAELSAAGLPSIAFMLDRRRTEFARVLARGRIEDGDEYRLLDSFVSDVDSGVDAQDRARAERLLSEFSDPA